MSIKVKPKRLGRPATGKEPLVGFRSPADLTAAINKFRQQEDDKPSQSEAIRRILKNWLSQNGYLDR